MNYGISIIICFHNAESKLQKTLEHIIKLKTEGVGDVELVLVDNNSSDGSEGVINETLSSFSGFPWKIVREEQPGLSFARSKGFAEAKYDILLYCDDDNWLASDYLQIGRKMLDSKPEIGILGGLGEEVSDEGVVFPEWFKSKENYYAVGPQAKESGRVLGERNVVYGAGMFIRKSNLKEIKDKGFTNRSSDRVGKSLSSGGDSELCLAFQVAGFQIWYDDRLKFKHFITRDRLDLDYLNKLSEGISGSRYIIRFYLDYLQGTVKDIPKFFWQKEAVYAMLGLIRNLNNSSLSKRNFHFLMFLLRARGSYEKRVREVVALCHKLSKA